MPVALQVNVVPCMDTVTGWSSSTADPLTKVVTSVSDQLSTDVPDPLPDPLSEVITGLSVPSL